MLAGSRGCGWSFAQCAVCFGRARLREDCRAMISSVYCSWRYAGTSKSSSGCVGVAVA